MTTSTLEAPAEQPRPTPNGAAALSHRQILTILSGLLLGMFLAALDQNIVSVAIVRIANSLHGFDKQAWATTAYLIAATITTPLYGKLADIYGRKPFFLTAIGLFVIGSAACTFATSMYELAGFRAFQGLGAGGLMSLALTIVGDIVPARQRVRYQGFFMMVFGVSTVIGPVLGGLFSGYDHLWGIEGWRWVFLVNVPIGIIALAVVAKTLNTPHQRKDHRIDWMGAVTLAVCVVPLLIVAEQGRGWGWGSNKAVICYAIAVVGFVLFLVVENFMKHEALIPLQLFRNVTFSVTILGGFIVGVGMFGSISMIPLYLQVVQGYSPTKSGLLMLPLVLGIMVSSLISGNVTRITGRYKFLPVVGTFIIAIGALLWAQVKFDSPLWQPLVYSAIIGFGLGGCMQTLIIAAQNAGPRSEMGVSTAAATFLRQMGGTLGVAVFLTILFNLLPNRITRAFGGNLPPGFDTGHLDQVQSNTSGIRMLPPQVRDPILIGFTNSLHGVFYAAAVVTLVATVVLLFMKEIPLKDGGEPDAHEPSELHDTRPLDELSATEFASDTEVIREPEPVLAGVGASAVSESANGSPVPRVMATAGAVPVASAGAGSNGHGIGGRIHRPDDHAVSGAVLTLIDHRGHQVSRTSSGSDGGYRLGAPGRGSYVLIASAHGHQPTASNVTVTDREQTLDLVLSGSGEISGVVREAQRGQPVEGATITVTDLRGEVVSSAVSDRTGRYTCGGVTAGSYTLVAVAAGLRPLATSLAVPDGGVRSFDIELVAMAVLTGVTRADGGPVANAQVTVLDPTGQPVATAQTDSDGQYQITDLMEGDYTVVARGYPPVASKITVAGREIVHDVQLGYAENTETTETTETNTKD